MFADGTKLGGSADFLEGQETLLRDLDRLEHCALTSDMKLNRGKCQVLQLRCNNGTYAYRLADK